VPPLQQQRSLAAGLSLHAAWNSSGRRLSECRKGEHPPSRAS